MFHKNSHFAHSSTCWPVIPAKWILQRLLLHYRSRPSTHCAHALPYLPHSCSPTVCSRTPTVPKPYRAQSLPCPNPTPYRGDGDGGASSRNVNALPQRAHMLLHVLVRPESIEGHCRCTVIGETGISSGIRSGYGRAGLRYLECGGGLLESYGRAGAGGVL